jgi:hypothetical protein
VTKTKKTRSPPKRKEETGLVYLYKNKEMEVKNYAVKLKQTRMDDGRPNRLLGQGF